MKLNEFLMKAHAASDLFNDEKESNAFMKGVEWCKNQMDKKFELDAVYTYYEETIVITDPCYIKNSVPEKERDTIYGDWSCMVYPGKMEENTKYKEWEEKYLKFWNEYNLGEKTDEEKEALYKEFRRFRLIWEDENIIGKFCADSGRVGIFRWCMLDKKNREWIKEHKNCAAVIPNFTGDINFVVKDNQLYVVGEGEKPFFSVQSGF